MVGIMFLKNSKNRNLFLLIILFLALDSLLITPYLISREGNLEKNPIHYLGFERLGLIYPFLAFPFEILFVFGILNLEEKFIIWELKRKKKDVNLKNKYISMTLKTIIIIQFIVILNNFFWTITL